MKFFILIGKLLLSALMATILFRSWQQNFTLGMVTGFAGTVASVYLFEQSMKKYIHQARWIAIALTTIFSIMSLDTIHRDYPLSYLLFVVGGTVFWLVRVFHYCDEIGAEYQQSIKTLG